MHKRFRLKVNIVKYLSLLFCLIVLSLTGCAKSLEDTKLVLTTGLSKDELFRVENISCHKPEIMVYLTNMQNQYESVYGSEIWNTQVDGQTLESNVKDNALAKMAQVKTMNLMAANKGLELSTQELKRVDTATDIYYDSLNNTEISLMGIDRDTIHSLYAEYLLAQKVYQYIIKDVNPEVSDDEARNITIEYILIKTYSIDGTGRRIQYSENARRDAKRRADEAYERAKDGESFDTLIAEYSEADEIQVSLGKDDIESDRVRTILFDLANNELSTVIEVEDGYLIAKCLNTYDLDETDQNKITIVEHEREAVFGEEYDAYVVELTRMLNDTLWNNITFIHDENVNTSDFFEVADNNLKLDEE